MQADFLHERGGLKTMQVFSATVFTDAHKCGANWDWCEVCLKLLAWVRSQVIAFSVYDTFGLSHLGWGIIHVFWVFRVLQLDVTAWWKESVSRAVQNWTSLLKYSQQNRDIDCWIAHHCEYDIDRRSLHHVSLNPLPLPPPSISNIPTPIRCFLNHAWPTSPPPPPPPFLFVLVFKTMHFGACFQFHAFLPLFSCIFQLHAFCVTIHHFHPPSFLSWFFSFSKQCTLRDISLKKKSFFFFIMKTEKLAMYCGSNANDLNVCLPLIKLITAWHKIRWALAQQQMAQWEHTCCLSINNLRCSLPPTPPHPCVMISSCYMVCHN